MVAMRLVVDLAKVGPVIPRLKMCHGGRSGCIHHVRVLAVIVADSVVPVILDAVLIFVVTPVLFFFVGELKCPRVLVDSLLGEVAVLLNHHSI